MVLCGSALDGIYPKQMNLFHLGQARQSGRTERESIGITVRSINTFTAGAYGLQVGVVWFVIGLVLIIAYQVYAHRTLWGKVPIMEQRADGLEVGRTP